MQESYSFSQATSRARGAYNRHNAIMVNNMTLKRLAVRAALPALLAATLTACAGLGGPPPAIGERMEAVKAKLGQPTAVYPVGGDTLLEYTTQPFGQYAYMARFGPDGALKSYEQVLTDEKFATLKVGLATRDEVLRTIGHPAETSYLSLRDLTVWSYRYKQSGVWNSLMHVHFDRAGVVREMMAGPDPAYEEKPRFFR